MFGALFRFAGGALVGAAIGAAAAVFLAPKSGEDAKAVFTRTWTRSSPPGLRPKCSVARA